MNELTVTERRSMRRLVLRLTQHFLYYRVDAATRIIEVRRFVSTRQRAAR